MTSTYAFSVTYFDAAGKIVAVRTIIASDDYEACRRAWKRKPVRARDFQVDWAAVAAAA